MARLVLGIKDYDGDRQQVSFEVDDVVNGAAYDADLTAAIALNDAILAVILGNQYSRGFVANLLETNPANPTDIFAQTNVQWIFQFVDNVDGSVHRTRVGTADLDLATEMFNGAPALPLGAGAGATLKAAFEAIVENDGHAVTLEAVYYKE